MPRYYHPSPPTRTVKQERTFEGISLDQPGSSSRQVPRSVTAVVIAMPLSANSSLPRTHTHVACSSKLCQIAKTSCSTANPNMSNHGLTLMSCGPRQVQQMSRFQLCGDCYTAEQAALVAGVPTRLPAGITLNALLMDHVDPVPPTSDEGNAPVESEFFDTRQAFLSLCQVRFCYSPDPGHECAFALPRKACMLIWKQWLHHYNDKLRASDERPYCQPFATITCHLLAGLCRSHKTSPAPQGLGPTRCSKPSTLHVQFVTFVHVRAGEPLPVRHHPAGEAQQHDGPLPSAQPAGASRKPVHAPAVSFCKHTSTNYTCMTAMLLL